MELLKVCNSMERQKEKCVVKTVPLVDHIFYKNFINYEIKYLSYGSNYFLFITNDNEIYIYGNVHFSYVDNSLRSMKFIANEKNVKYLQCDAQNIIIVNIKNEIYVQGNINQHFFNLKKLYQFNNDIKFVRCAKSTFFIVTTDNLIYEYDDVLKDFTMINEINEVVKDLQGGVDHVFFLNNTGEIYCEGENGYGQLGLGNQVRRIEQFTKVILNISIKSKVKKIGCYNYGTFILNNYNELYGTGFNEYYQLGLGHKSDVFTFTRIVIQTTIKNIYKTHNYYTILQDIDNNFYVSGNNYIEKLGIKNDDWSNCLTKFTKLDYLKSDGKFNYLLPLFDNLFILKSEKEIQQEVTNNDKENLLGLSSFHKMKRKQFVDIYFTF